MILRLKSQATTEPESPYRLDDFCENIQAALFV